MPEHLEAGSPAHIPSQSPEPSIQEGGSVVKNGQLEFESGHFLQSLFANRESLLRVLEKELKVKATTRDGWIRFEGDTQPVEDAVQLFQSLERYRREGSEVSESLFRMSLEAAKKHESSRVLQELGEYRLMGSKTKPAVVPQTLAQVEYIRAMRNSDVVFGVGSAGTGKTYLAMAQGLQMLRDKEVNRIILSRPAVEAGEALGFLPGDLQEKLFPYLRPLYDALYDMIEPDEVEKFIDNGVMEIAPLAYMRGRTLSKAFVILDEAQNTTREQMLMFLTRLGQGSRTVITGDPTQIDLKHRRDCGLKEALQNLEGVEGVEQIHFAGGDVVRHPVVGRIIAAYEKSRSDQD